MRKNRLIRSYAGKLMKAFTTDNMETTLSIVEIPVIEHDDPLDDEDIEQGKNLLFQCDCCKRSIEIILDKKANIIGAKCPDCDNHGTHKDRYN